MSGTWVPAKAAPSTYGSGTGVNFVLMRSRAPPRRRPPGRLARRRGQCSHELLFDDADRARDGAHELELADLPKRVAQPRLAHGMRDHDEPRALAHAALDDGLDRHAVLAEHRRHRPEHPRLVGHLEMHVERAVDVVDEL